MVSLFTREWIEIAGVLVINRTCGSPSLRGSGLKFCDPAKIRTGDFVSLFTREWIEIKLERISKAWHAVSLFTREWIEIFWLSPLL